MKKLVVKLSSLAVTTPRGQIDRKKIAQIVSDVETFTKKNYQVILVCSGAVNAGKKFVENFSRAEMSSMQASSAVGQPKIMQAFAKEFQKYHKAVGQVLVTHDDFKHKTRSLNIRSSLNQLLQNKIVPIINENDTVSFDEITLGDNDQLSALICELMEADILCMLTEADGLFDRDPKDKDARKFSRIEFDQEFTQINTASKTVTGSGGMKTKLEAVRKLTPLGVNVYIASYKFPKPISRTVLEKEGSWFVGMNKKLTKKNAWIITRVRSGVYITIDAGAKAALLNNSSLLPVGIKSTKGKFSRGDCVSIKCGSEIIGYGLVEYSSSEVEKIKKYKSSEIATRLKNSHSKVVVHKNNLILKRKLT